MPTYEYRCRSCGTEFERFQKITSRPVTPCPKCGARAERLLSAGAGLVFKGSGFYITDYKRAGEKKEERGEKKEERGEKREEKPAAKAESREKAHRKKKEH